MQEITWTNCAEELPPSTPDWIIVSDGYGTHICDGMAVNHDYGICIDVEAKWAPYTPEKWKELNK